MLASLLKSKNYAFMVKALFATVILGFGVEIDKLQNNLSVTSICDSLF